MVTVSEPVGGRTAREGAERPVGELVSRASEQLTELVRAELRLAQREMKDKGKRFGRGGGLFGGAGTAALFGAQAAVAAVIAALALAVPWWAAAAIVAVLLFAAAAVMGALGKKEVDRASPPVPEEALHSAKADMAEIRERAHR
ncbi:phage holin family protein [Streptomyces sp. NPDC059506]|uniref:phage holin family protein n=1 Tax=Streptomyces sp. NPDC059506 TaxID=3347751 RepID=UPI0015FD3356